MQRLNCFTNSWILLLLLLLFSCHRPRTEKQVAVYIANEKNGLTQTKKANEVDIRVTYRPQDFLVKQVLDASLVKSDSLINVLKSKYYKQLYFVLTLSKNNREVLTSVAADKALFSEMVSRLAFELGNYITLTTSNKDTLELVDFIYPRMYGMSSSTDILLAFKNEKLEKAEFLKFSVADMGLQTGNVNFTFNIKDIKKTPNLKLR